MRVVLIDMGRVLRSDRKSGLDRLAVIGKLHLQFVNRDHSFSSSRNDNKVKSFILKRHSLYTDTSLVYRESVLK